MTASEPSPRQTSVSAMWARAARSETRRLLALRSMWIVLVLACGFSLLVGYLTVHSLGSAWSSMSPEERRATDPTADSFTGLEFAQLAFASWAAATITGEYARRTIDITMTAVPRRGVLFLAKVTPVALLGLAFGELAAAASLASARLALAGSGLAIGWADPHVARSIAGAGLVVGVVTVVGFGLGAIVRHTAAAVAGVVALVFLAWPVARAAEGWSHVPDRWVLVNAADALVATKPSVGVELARTPSVGYALGVMAAYVIVTLALGALRMRQDT